MTNIAVTGLPAIAWSVGFIIVGAFPVWIGAKITGANQPTLLRSILALIVGTVGAFLGSFAGMPLCLVLWPLAYLFAFKFILDTSFFGALLLGIVAVTGYFLMAKFIGGGFSTKPEPEAMVAPRAQVAFVGRFAQHDAAGRSSDLVLVHRI